MRLKSLLYLYVQKTYHFSFYLINVKFLQFSPGKAFLYETLVIYEVVSKFEACLFLLLRDSTVVNGVCPLFIACYENPSNYGI